MPITTTRNQYGSPVSQGYDPQALSLLFSNTVEVKYEDAVRVGDQFWTTSPEDTKGDNFVKAFRTRLLGNLALAAAEGTDLDDRPPYLSFKRVPVVLGSYKKYFAAFGFNEEYVNYDERDTATVDVMADLADVALFTEELLRHEPLNNGLTWASGWDKDGSGNPIPLYAANHPIIGDRTVLTDNIIDSVSGASYATIRAIDEYGMNFVNMEGRPAMVKPETIITGPAMARELRRLYGSTTDLSQSNPNVPSPVAGSATPTIIESIHLSNPNDIHVRYTGWRENFFEIDKYRGKTETWTEKNPNYTFTKIETRCGYYYIDPRLAAFIPGVS